MKTIHPAIAEHAMEENEKLRGLLRELREITSEYAWDADLEARVDAALSRQAEPAPAQDDGRSAFQAYLNECAAYDFVPSIAGAFHFAWQASPGQPIRMPPSPYTPDVEPESMTDYERGEAQGRCDMWAMVKELNAARPAHTEQQATVKDCLTVQSMAYAVFAANGNAVCFSTRRDHPSLVALEKEGHSVVSLAPIKQTEQPVNVPEGWLIELGFDVLDRTFRFVESKSHTPTIKVILPPCEPDDSSAWDLRDEVARRIGSVLATPDMDAKEA